MRTAQIRLQEIRGVFRRRWKLMVLPVILVTTVGTIGAYMLPRKYVSSTTILVQPDQTLTSLSAYDLMAALDAQLRNYNEIIYSRSFGLALLDSLQIGRTAKTEVERQVLVDKIRAAIRTNRLGSDSFTISYEDADPYMAQRGAAAITNLFIQTKVAVTNQQNALTVEFLEKKVEEYRQEFEASARSVVSVMKEKVDELPAGTKALYTRIDDVENKMAEIDIRLRTFRDALAILRTLPSAIEKNPEILRSDTGKQPLLHLQDENLPLGDELRNLIAKYEDATRRYTGMYPEVQNLEKSLTSLLERMRIATESEIVRLETSRTDLEKRRAQSIEELKKSSVSTRENPEKMSNYEINQKLYNEMKMKLEAARLNADVGSRGANQFVILDPATVPFFPTRPNRTMIIAGSMGGGILLGIIIAIVAELFDSTIRTTGQMEVYGKPVIALLPDTRNE